MAPNLISKSMLNGSYTDSGNTSAPRPTSLRTKSQVRTDVLVNSIFYHLLEGQTDIFSLNASELKVIDTFKKLVSDFKSSYNENVVELCSQLDITSGNVKGVILGVLNELFSGGITWARIVTLFVFTSELASQCLKRELPQDMVDNVKNCCLEFVEVNMEKWVQDHGGWEGIVSFAHSSGRQNSDNQQSSGRKNSDKQQLAEEGATSPGWAKSMLHGTVRMIGTLAQLANYTEPMMALPINKVRL